MGKNWWKELDSDTDAIGNFTGLGSINMDIIIGEDRPLTEECDIDLDLPSILENEILPTSGIIVQEHTSTVDRNDFVLAYLIAKEKGNVDIRQCW